MVSQKEISSSEFSGVLSVSFQGSVHETMKSWVVNQFPYVDPDISKRLMKESLVFIRIPGYITR